MAIAGGKTWLQDAYTTFPGTSQYCGPWDIAIGGGADGEGGVPPSPVSTAYGFSRYPPPIRYICNPHPARPSASSPAPKGAGAVRGDTRWEAVSRELAGKSSFSEIFPFSEPWEYRHRGRRLAGRGGASPLPVSIAPTRISEVTIPNTSRKR